MRSGGSEELMPPSEAQSCITELSVRVGVLFSDLQRSTDLSYVYFHFLNEPGAGKRLTPGGTGLGRFARASKELLSTSVDV
jgi:hypothetical protein